jgi:aminoglycoside phosphotransferase (APT) family kinase protein
MNVEKLVCQLTGASAAHRKSRLQSLWRGYGEVVRYELDNAQARSVVVKVVRPPAGAHPRKLRSYQVEAAWYGDLASRCSSQCRVPRCLGTHSKRHTSVFVLEDLHASGFRLPLRPLDGHRLRLALSWLASFHATFMGVSPVGLWDVGTYWHLATRPKELRAMRNKRLRAMASELDQKLSTARFQTLVHGDAKPANFLLSEDRKSVAAVDFQYVGGGCGMKDVAYLLDDRLRASTKNALLQHYFDAFRAALAPEWLPQADAIEAEWRALLPVAELDFARFLDGWGA